MTNKYIEIYTKQVNNGEIVKAYKAILAFIYELRGAFVKRFPKWYVGSIYQGYMDMSYFPVTCNELKKKGLKIAVVYLHDKNVFEVWLSAKNRKILNDYRDYFNNIKSQELNIYHEEYNEDSVIEYLVIKKPDFENIELLKNKIEVETVKFYDFVISSI